MPNPKEPITTGRKDPPHVKENLYAVEAQSMQSIHIDFPEAALENAADPVELKGKGGNIIPETMGDTSAIDIQTGDLAEAKKDTAL